MFIVHGVLKRNRGPTNCDNEDMRYRSKIYFLLTVLLPFVWRKFKRNVRYRLRVTNL